MSKPVRIVVLPEQNYEILLNVLASFCAGGVDPKHLRAMADTYDCLLSARTLDADSLGTPHLKSVGPEGVKLEYAVAREVGTPSDTPADTCVLSSTQEGQNLS
jgi:hypothetical protein